MLTGECGGMGDRYEGIERVDSVCGGVLGESVVESNGAGSAHSEEWELERGVCCCRGRTKRRYCGMKSALTGFGFA